jgi:hypothetical protein
MTINRTGANLTAWSVSTYWLILHVYPSTFRGEFGESMAQVFGDSARDAWNRAGVRGLLELWRRTVVDVAVSLVRAYAGEPRGPIFKLTAGLSILYVCAVAAIVGYGALRFDEFYQAPAFSRFGAPAAHENVLIAAYEQALRGEFGRYRAFTMAAGFSLAILLGVTAALFGLWQKSVLHGAGALVGGTALTMVAFELLPVVWFPLDRYPVGALWLMGGGVPLAAGTCLLVVMLGRLRPARGRFTHS